MLHLMSLTHGELARHADSWDDLWQRSDVRLPTKRAQGIELWRQSFAPNDQCQTIVIRDSDRFVAGIPLVKDKSRWPLTIYRMPTNATVGAGDFLLDPECDIDAATQLIVRHINRLPGTLAAFEGIEIYSHRWRRLMGAFQQLGREMHLSPGHDVGLVDILHDWDAYTQAWSRNHRSSIKRSRKKLEAAGEVQVQRLRNASDDELDAVLEACYTIEDKGWKGANGTSIRRTPGLGEYYHREARMMRDLGMLDLWLLKLDGQIIAFEYCQFSKATCFSHKISYDSEFDRFSPGQVLRCIQLEQYHQDPAAESLDTLGVLCEAKAKWATRTYKSSRCYVAIGGQRSNLLLRGMKWGRRLATLLRGTRAEVTPIQPSAERYLQLAGKTTTAATR